MALLEILHFPNPKLKELAKPITEFNDELQQFIDDMFETMYEAQGVGLAATQVGIAKRVAVIDISRDSSKPMVLINPEVISRENIIEFQEGCLSVPGHWDKLTRANKITMKALDRHGKPYEIEAEDLLAECIQHEVDHLNGKLYIEYLSAFKQSRIREKLVKNKKLADKKR